MTHTGGVLLLRVLTVRKIHEKETFGPFFPLILVHLVLLRGEEVLFLPGNPGKFVRKLIITYEAGRMTPAAPDEDVPGMQLLLRRPGWKPRGMDEPKVDDIAFDRRHTDGGEDYLIDMLSISAKKWQQ